MGFACQPRSFSGVSREAGAVLGASYLSVVVDRVVCLGFVFFDTLFECAKIAEGDSVGPTDNFVAAFFLRPEQFECLKVQCVQCGVEGEDRIWWGCDF